ncbi:MAG: sigma-70 family RNA polymerase sigma factor, partial [Bacteroidota bacterium]|nr:sigma-70 family RNA polymerase sigma factor [Bacteroidota bacterium]
MYHSYAEKLFGVCLRYSRSRHDAEEILQEGFIKVFASLHQYKSEGSFEGWIRKIIVNTALQRYRRPPILHPFIGTEQSASGQIVDETEGAESALSAKELLQIVQSLPTTYRLVFNLYVFEGYKHKEIAQLLHISEGTSKSNLYDARQWLK